MKDDLKLIRSKIKAANKLPQSNPVEYNLKRDILMHWRLELYMLKFTMTEDLIQLELMHR